LEENAKKQRGLEIIARTSNPKVRMIRLDDDEIEKLQSCKAPETDSEKMQEEAAPPLEKTPQVHEEELEKMHEKESEKTPQGHEEEPEKTPQVHEEESEKTRGPEKESSEKSCSETTAEMEKMTDKSMQADQGQGSTLKPTDEEEEEEEEEDEEDDEEEEVIVLSIKKEPSDNPEVAIYDAMQAYNDASVLVAQHKRCTLNREIAAWRQNRRLWLRSGRLRDLYANKLVKIIKALRFHGESQTADDFAEELVKAAEEAGEMDAYLLAEGFGFES
jgi:hypothetical protein